MKKINIVDMLNMAKGEVSFNNSGNGGFVASNKANAEVIKDAIIEALSDIDVFDKEQTECYYPSATNNYYTQEDLDSCIDLVCNFGIASSEVCSVTVWFE